jgi:uncharacterized protein (TIGR00299 family) protein
MDRVHFHEVGAVDSIVDIVGAAAMIAWLDPAEIICSPVPMGKGVVRARHGVLPLPAPAALECLRGVPTYGLDLQRELVTPTGAAIISTLCSRFETWPTMTIERIGFGSGASDLGDRPNLLRVVLGSKVVTGARADTNSHVLVEANMDDLTGELAGHVLGALLEAGALDAWIVPTTTKKGRPGVVMSALVETLHADAVMGMLLRESTTLGVREHYVGRIVRPREVEKVKTRYGQVSVKVSGGGFGPDQVKPEFDDCVKLARRRGVPVREVVAAALTAYRVGRDAK